MLRGMGGARRAMAACVAAVVGAASGAASAQESTLEDFGFARQRISLASGYGWGFGAFGTQGDRTARMEMVPIVAAWSYGSNPLLEASPLVGNVELQVEGQTWLTPEPRDTGFGGGVAFTVRYNALGLDPLYPFVEGGLGAGGIDFDLDQRDGFNFIVQSGAGLHLRLGSRWALTSQYRFHHISNADTRSPNPGINTHMLLVGPTFFLD